MSTIDAIANPYRSIELDIDIGADARDWSSIQVQEKLRPVETELRRIEELVGEVVSEMEYLRTREQKLRDTNESTNERVKWFAFGTMGMLVGLGAWQVVYLRAYFRFLSLSVSCPCIPWSMGLLWCTLMLIFTDPSILSRVAGYVEMDSGWLSGLYEVISCLSINICVSTYSAYDDSSTFCIYCLLLPFLFSFPTPARY